MRFSALFEGFTTPANTSPKPVLMTAHVLQNTILPIGVFYEKRPKPEPGILMAIPLAIGLKVSWIAEAGILYCDGSVIAVGKAYPSASRRSASDRVSMSESLPDVVEAIFDGAKVEFVEFINEYFEAVRRGAVVSQETAQRLREMLVRASTEHQFIIAKTEDELEALIEAHRAESKTPG